MDRFDFASSAYKLELDRRRELNSAVATPAGLITLFVAAIFTLAGEISIPVGWISSWLSIACAGAAITAVVSIFFLVRAYHSFTYRFIPTVAELESWRSDIIALGYTPIQADEQLREFLITSYANANDINTINNEAKSGYLYRATQGLVGCLVALMIASPAYLLSKSTREALKPKIKNPICYVECRSKSVAPKPTLPTAASPAASPTAADAGREGESCSPRLPVRGKEQTQTGEHCRAH